MQATKMVLKNRIIAKEKAVSVNIPYRDCQYEFGNIRKITAADVEQNKRDRHYKKMRDIVQDLSDKEGKYFFTGSGGSLTRQERVGLIGDTLDEVKEKVKAMEPVILRTFNEGNKPFIDEEMDFYADLERKRK